MDTRISSWCSASGPCPDGNSPVGSEVINSEWGSRTSMSTMRAETLDNGLLILLAEQRTVPVATFWVWYRVGSRNEMPGLTGISHWVEHMLFKGTPTHPKGMLTRHIDRLGGRWNAFTWKDYTAYHEVLPADHLGVAITLEADRMINTVMEPAEVESERTVIISEREGSENYPAYLLREEVDAAAHKVHPYRIPVIGWKDDLRAITRDDLSHHYQTYYHPNNAVAVAVGPFDAHAVMEAIKQAFAGIPPGSSPPRVRVREPQQEGERRVVLRRPGGATAYLHIAFHVPSASHQDLAARLVADGLLPGLKSFVPFDQGGGGRSSRLYRALVDSGLASDAGTALTPGADPTLFRVTVTARAGVDPAAVERRTLEEVERLAREAAGPLELEKVKKQAKAQDVFSRDGVFRTAMGLGAFTIVDGPEAFASLLTRIDRVTLDDVLRVADTYFTEKNRTVGWYLPEGGATTAGARAAVRPEVFFLAAAPGATPSAADHPTDCRPHRTAKRHGGARQRDAGDRPGRGARVRQGRRHVRWDAQRPGALCRRNAAAGNPPVLLAGTGRASGRTRCLAGDSGRHGGRGDRSPRAGRRCGGGVALARRRADPSDVSIRRDRKGQRRTADLSPHRNAGYASDGGARVPQAALPRVAPAPAGAGW